jgi:predicted aspartyl protease
VPLLLLAAYSCPAADLLTSKTNPPPPTSSSREVPFRLFRGYVVVVQGSLGELAGRQLLVDTGSSPTIIDYSVAHRLRLPFRPAQLSQVNREGKARSVILPNLTLGPIDAKYLPVLVADLSFIQRQLGIHIDAVVGLDVLSPRSFSIDYQSRKIIFGQLPTSTDSVPFETQPPLITIKANVQGRDLRLLVDTGASGLMLFRERNNLNLPVTSAQRSDNISGMFTREQVEVSDLRVGNLYRHKQTAYLVESPDNIARDFDGIAGISALGIKQIAFDFEHGILSWK